VLSSESGDHVRNYQHGKNSAEHGRNFRRGPSVSRSGCVDDPARAGDLRKVVAVVILHFAWDVSSRV
jgi:hypothetical protein